MRSTHALRWRAAQQLFWQARRPPVLEDQTASLWRRYHHCLKQLKWCRRLSLPAAERHWQQQLLRNCQLLEQTLRDFRLTLISGEERLLPTSVAEIAADLAALEVEFLEVRLNLRDRTLTFTTPTITLAGIDLGEFQIQIHWQPQVPELELEIVALRPHPAASDPETVHPHVNAGELCAGTSRPALQRALEQRRLLDACLMISSLLQTYHPGSAYCALEKWQQTPCPDCSEFTDPEDFERCTACSRTSCAACGSACERCHDHCCAHCVTACGDCRDLLCPDCLATCKSCGDQSCDSCLHDQACAACQPPDSDPQTESELHDHNTSFSEIPPS